MAHLWNEDCDSGTKPFYGCSTVVLMHHLSGNNRRDSHFKVKRDFPDSQNPAFSEKNQPKRETVKPPPGNQLKSSFRISGTVIFSTAETESNPGLY